MGKLPVIYGRNKLPGSLLIRAFTWSRWSHCGLLTPCGDFVIEATAGSGVVMTTIGRFKKRYPDHYMGYMPCADVDKAYRLANELLGLPYDWSAVIGLGVRHHWDDPTKWFCSEVLAHVSQLFRPERVGRITPEDCFAVTHDKFDVVADQVSG